MSGLITSGINQAMYHLRAFLGKSHLPANDKISFFFVVEKKSIVYK
jgi:hypothetical protein